MTGILVLVLMPFMVFLPDFSELLQYELVGIILVWGEILAIRMYLVNRNRVSRTNPELRVLFTPFPSRTTPCAAVTLIF